MPGSSRKPRAIRRGGQKNTLQPGEGICFVYVQLYDDSTGELLANTQYTLRGLQRGTTITGTTDEEGILRHEFLLDDDYELDCNGKTEIVEVYYMDEPEHQGIEPWRLWMWRSSQGG